MSARKLKKEGKIKIYYDPILVKKLIQEYIHVNKLLIQDKDLSYQLAIIIENLIKYFLNISNKHS